MNLSELGKKTSIGSVMAFDRWGIKKRLEGTKQFLGLIPSDYVSKIRINKKETKYALTLKGLFASFSQVKFEDIYLIKRYAETLGKYTDSNNKIKFILEYIKMEIAYLLYYNYIQGLNWKKFRFLKSYMKKQRSTFRGNFNLELTIVEKLLTKNQRTQFKSLRKNYGKFYQLADMSTGAVRPERVYRAWVRKKRNKIFSPKIREIISLFLYMRWWYTLIDLPKIEMPNSTLVGNYLDHWDFDLGRAFLRLPRREREEFMKRSS